MAPKKKGKKQDGWEAELGKAPDPIAAATQEAKEADVAAESEEAEEGGGGLLAALKKNKSNKKKKGKHVEEDYVDGEDPPAENGLNGHAEPNGIQDLAAKAPEEATTDDLFAEQVTKAKGGKGKQGKKEGTLQPNEDGEGEEEEGGTVKSKKEKEKEKKEREKQRKKEQVSRNAFTGPIMLWIGADQRPRLLQRRNQLLLQHPRKRLSRPSRRPLQNPHQLPMQAKARRKCQLLSQRSRRNRKS